MKMVCQGSLTWRIVILDPSHVRQVQTRSLKMSQSQPMLDYIER